MKKIYIFIAGLIIGMLDDIYQFLVSNIPTKMEFMAGSIGASIGWILQHTIGSYDDTIEALLFLMLIDIITGVWASVRYKQFLLNSQKGFKGITKKVGVLIIIVSAFELGRALPYTDAEALKDYVACAYCGIEILSIIENLGKCGVPLPHLVRNKLQQLATQKEERGNLSNEKDNTRRIEKPGNK